MSVWRFLDWPAWPRRLTTALFFLGLNWLLLAPTSTFEEIQELLPHQDKIVHTCLFLTLAFLVRWSTEVRDQRVRRRYWVAAALVLYAGAIEALQPVLGGVGRTFEWLDLASNFAGVCSGWLLFGTAVATRLKCGDGPLMIKRATDKSP